MSLTILTIVLMALTTYLTRIGGYLLLRDRAFSPRIKAVMEAAPGCVLITVIAPHFVTSNPADLLALAISLLAAMRFSLLPVVVISVVATALYVIFFKRQIRTRRVVSDASCDKASAERQFGSLFDGLHRQLGFKALDAADTRQMVDLKLTIGV